MKPKILLSAKGKEENYRNAVLLGGGEPFLAEPGSCDAGFDGLILCGGGDIEPERYRQTNEKCMNIDPQRDEREFELLNQFVKAKKPVLGICRGLQVINVAFGGNLIQHLPNASCHVQKEGKDQIHETEMIKESFLYPLYGNSMITNSAHHQAIDRLGQGLTAVQWADGVIEGIAHESLPIFAVQWHPERMSGVQRRPDTPDGAPIFCFFTSICKRVGSIG